MEYIPRKNSEGKYIINLDNPKDKEWINRQQGKRGAKAVDEGRKKIVPLATTLLAGAVFGPLSVAGSIVGSESINKATNLISNNKYNTWGDFVSNKGKNFPVEIGELTNPGALIGGPSINKQIIPKINIGDKYTTIGGRFGYYGNPIERVTGTIKRNLNIKTKPKNPELLRKLKNDINIENNKIQVSNPSPRRSETITNFTTDRPVVSHSGGNWDSADLFIFDPKIVKGKQPISIEPSDTFYVGENIIAKPNQTTLISGNKSSLIKAKEEGLSTLSSKKLRDIYDNMNSEYLKGLTENNKLTGIKKKLAKNKFDDIVNSNLRKKYADEIQNLQSKRGTPTIKDYMNLEKQTGLNSGTIDFKNFDFNLWKRTMKKNGEISYPNGRKVYFEDYRKDTPYSENTIIKNSKYNKVFYDPTTEIEGLYRKTNNIKTL